MVGGFLSNHLNNTIMKTKTGKTHTASFGSGPTGGGVIRKLTKAELKAQKALQGLGK
jgi:hypothetical protein